MDCQDCSKNKATTIIFSTKDLRFYAICNECIEKEDYILGDGLLKEFIKEL